MDKISNPDLWVWPKGGRLDGETGVKQVTFKVVPKGCNRRTISYLKVERVPMNRGIVTEVILKLFGL